MRALSVFLFMIGLAGMGVGVHYRPVFAVSQFQLPDILSEDTESPIVFPLNTTIIEHTFKTATRRVYNPPGHCVSFSGNVYMVANERQYMDLRPTAPGLVTLTKHHGSSKRCQDANK